MRYNFSNANNLGNEFHVVVQHGLVKYEKEVEGSYSETIHEADARSYAGCFHGT